MARTVCLTFTPTVRVVDWVHRGTTCLRSDTHVTCTSGFTDNNVCELLVTDRTDCCHTYFKNVAHLTAWQSKNRVFTFTTHQLSVASGTSCDLSAFTRFHLDVVYDCTDRDAFEWHCVTCNDVQSSFSRSNSVTDIQTTWLNDVTFFTVSIVDQGDTAVSVRIVFDRSYRSRNVHFVSFEVDQTVVLFSTRFFVSGCDTTVVVTTSMSLQFYNQPSNGRFGSNVFVGDIAHEPSTRGIWFICFNCHCLSLYR